MKHPWYHNWIIGRTATLGTLAIAERFNQNWAEDFEINVPFQPLKQPILPGPLMRV